MLRCLLYFTLQICSILIFKLQQFLLLSVNCISPWLCEAKVKYNLFIQNKSEQMLLLTVTETPDSRPICVERARGRPISRLWPSFRPPTPPLSPRIHVLLIFSSSLLAIQMIVESFWAYLFLTNTVKLCFRLFLLLTIFMFVFLFTGFKSSSIRIPIYISIEFPTLCLEPKT